MTHSMHNVKYKNEKRILFLNILRKIKKTDF